MRYIDKSKPEVKRKAHAILKQFVDGQWQEEEQAYINLSYENFDNKPALSGLLLKEQDFFCCYCMRHITEDDVTLEHIIPNKSQNPDEFEVYKAYGHIGTEVFFWKKSTRTNRISAPPFPHILAYENLVASCNGFIPKEGRSGCCNNRRGSKEIVPLFYLVNTKQEFKYDVRGMIVCDAKYNDTINTLALEHATLQLFRRCWLNLPSQYNVSDVFDAGTNMVLRKQIVDDMDFSNVSVSDRTTIVNDVYWTSFMNYFWFYLYKQGKGH